MPLEFRLEPAEMSRDLGPQIEQADGLRDIVKIDFPAVIVFSETPEDRRHHAWPLVGKPAQRIVDVAAGGSAMREIAVRPSLAWGRGGPAGRDAELQRQPADDRDLGGQEIMHYPARVLRGPGPGLARIVVDEPAHLGRPAAIAAKTEKLDVDVLEQFARLWIGQTGRFFRNLAAVPYRHLLDGAVLFVPGVAFGALQPVELLASRVELAEQAIERAVFEHQDDDVLDRRHASSHGNVAGRERRPGAVRSGKPIA